MWNELSSGAIGAVVLVDTRRLADCFAGDRLLRVRAGVPFVVGVNLFDGARDAPVSRSARRWRAARVPLLTFDARDRQDAKAGLISLVELALRRERAKTAPLNPVHVQLSPPSGTKRDMDGSGGGQGCGSFR